MVINLNDESATVEGDMRRIIYSSGYSHIHLY